MPLSPESAATAWPTTTSSAPFSSSYVTSSWSPLISRTRNTMLVISAAYARSVLVGAARVGADCGYDRASPRDQGRRPGRRRPDLRHAPDEGLRTADPVGRPGDHPARRNLRLAS